MLRWAKNRLSARRGVIVLTFHRVLPESEFSRVLSPEGMVVKENTFEELLRYLNRNYPAARLNGHASPFQEGKSGLQVALTFDDGWVDNVRFAAPIAQKYDISFTIFVCPGRMGASLPFWPDRMVAICEKASAEGRLSEVLRFVSSETGKKIDERPSTTSKTAAREIVECLKTLPADRRRQIVGTLLNRFIAKSQAYFEDVYSLYSTMTWEDAQRLSGMGINFGSHTQTHQILTRIEPSLVQAEVEQSKLAVEQHLGQECLMFAYPNGEWTPEARALLEKTGYSKAFRNDPGVWRETTDPFLIPRLNVWERSLVDPWGKFSPLAFDYAVLWECFRSRAKASDHSHTVPSA
ncbi:MAG: polysaccharide deacetylase family protein [Candidatus Acidiferrales bacterium]